MQLKLNKLTKAYNKNKVLDKVDFTFESGKIYGIIGRNGAGKTTLFRTINKDISIDSGNIKLDNSNLTINSIGFVESEENVPEFLTAKEFLTFFLEINKDKIKNPKTKEEYFKMIDLREEDQNKIMKEYSKGMKNKVELLINIINNPKILLLDEPLTSLDIVVQEEMKNILKKEKKDKIIMISTHILEIALDLCDEIVILNNQKLELVDKKDLNTKKYKDKIIRALKESKDA
ncbi:MAG: ABC transporter ATP-binding protein [Bacilli bacterium]|nr:ABC transporter ATP-binding protein [Bacilli bacterium]